MAIRTELQYVTKNETRRIRKTLLQCTGVMLKDTQQSRKQIDALTNDKQMGCYSKMILN